jgi:hypothetical protein
VPRVTLPEIGNVTDAVANSPTAPFTGVYSVISTVPENAGFDALVPVPFGFTMKEAVDPMSGARRPSIAE